MDIILKIVEEFSRSTNGGSAPYIKKELFVDKAFVFPFRVEDNILRARLSPIQYSVLRKQKTEKPFSGEYDKLFEKGTYYSLATAKAVFSSEDKFNSGTGWPSFTRPIEANAVYYRLDRKWGVARTEVIDTSGSHLGHVFQDGPEPTGLRYCMNSEALIFVPESEKAPSF